MADEILFTYLRATSEADPSGRDRCKFVVHRRYWGPSPERHMGREHLVDDLLGYLGLAARGLQGVSLPPGIAEVDLLFTNK